MPQKRQVFNLWVLLQQTRDAVTTPGIKNSPNMAFLPRDLPFYALSIPWAKIHTS